MNNVVDLSQKRQEKEPHISGPVICGGCKHEWVGVAPVTRGQKFEMECPKCGAFRGIWKYNFTTEQPTLECPACTGHIFQVSDWGVFCCGCGESASFKTIFGE